ncbi:MAG TPA: hypothetical protein VMD02_03785 [Candidatus Omnitrophota bacterium]|nr:hypothetical protein [Candidatus Omnitrophota bacterium]
MLRSISLLLVSFILMNGLPVIAAEPVQHLYLDNSVRTVILTADRKDLRPEAAEFRDFRNQYAIFWTAVIITLVAYGYSRGK